MRWILLCLISFNLIYFIWKQFYDVMPVTGLASGEVVEGELNKDSQESSRLVLLQEVLSTAGTAAPPPSINPQMRQSSFKASTEVSGQASGAVAKDETGSADSDVANNSGVANNSHGDISATVTQEAERESAAEPAVRPKVCADVGPYVDQAQAQQLLQQLLARNVNTKLREEKNLVDSDNWVLIPPLGSRKEALKLLRRLQGNKIDSYLITEGEFSNGISLGLFKKPESAQGVLANMSTAGYEAEVHQINRYESQYWVVLAGEYEPDSLTQMLTQLVDDSEKINFSETLCEMFASTP